MAVVPDFFDRIERSFEDYPCIMATGIGSTAVAGVLIGRPDAAALLAPAVAMYGTKCLGKQPTIPGPGYARPFLGGQCSGQYQYRIRFKDRTTGGLSNEPVFTLTGPIRSIYTLIANNGFGQPRWFLRANHGGGSLNLSNDLGLNPSIWEFDRESLVRVGGQPDNCGDPSPLPVPPIVPPNPYPPQPTTCPPNSICIPEYPVNVPLPDPGGGKPTFLPLVIPPVIIPFAPVFPITVPINLGGIKIGSINIAFNGSMKFDFTSPAVQSQDYSQILSEIKDCACRAFPVPDCPTETKNLPYLDKTGDVCSIKTASVVVKTGGLSPDVADKLQATAEKALDMCRSDPPPQKPEVLLGTGTVPFPAVEQFVTGITTEIRSVRLKIKSFSESACPAISTYPGAAQRKFGSIGFSLPPAAAGGDYVYVFDPDTYYPIPEHGKAGLIRLLLKSGTEWELYDTGERL